MKRTLTLFFMISALIAAASPEAIAQAPTPVLGDLGSVKTGMWDTVSTWKTYSSNGLFDSVSVVPSSSKNVFVTTGTTVTYQTSSKNCKNLVVQSGAVLQSDQVLPTSSIKYLKINGPTVWIDGQFGRDTADVLSLEMLYNNNTTTISGSGVINIARLRPNSSSTGDLGFVFNTNARFNYFGSTGTGGAGIYTTNGSGTSVTITVNPGVTVNFAPNCYIGTTSSASSNGNMNTTYNINGTINLLASSIVMANVTGKTSAFHVGSTGTVNLGDKYTSWLSGGSVATTDIAAGGVMNILNGGKADFTEPTSKVTGAGTFALQAGGTINIGAPAGLDSANGPVQTAVALFDTGAGYSYVGTGVQQWGAMLPDSISGLTIGASSIDTAGVDDPKKVTGLLQIDGLLVNTGGLTSAGLATVNGTYQHHTASGPMPLATWNTGSTCLVTLCASGVSTGIPNGNQNFYNFTFDNPTLSGVPRFGMAGDTLRGNLTIHNTNTSAVGDVNFVAMCPSTVNTTVTVLGNVVIDTLAGSFTIGYGSGVCKQTLDLKGNLISKGWFFFNGSGVSNKLLARGNIILSNPNSAAFKGHSSTVNPEAVIYCGTGLQQFIKPLAQTSMTHLAHRVQAGSALMLNDTTVLPYSGNGSFTLDSGGTMIFGHPNGVNGNLAAATPPGLSSGANYIFHSGSAQVTGMWFPGTVNKFDVDDSLGLTLSDTVTVTDTLRLKTGNLAGTDSSMVCIASTGAISRTNNYIIGRLQKQFAAPGVKDFEVGTANGYSPVNVNVTTGSGAMTVTAQQGQHPNTFNAAKTLARYWTLKAEPAITQADLKFSYLASDVAGTESSYGAYRYTGTGTAWTALTSINNVGAHWVSTAGVTSFSDWTLGESSVATAVRTSEENGIPKTFYVEQNYPNPFNPSTRVTYGIPNAGNVSVKVYNLLGQEVATIVNGQQAAGVYTVTFDGTRLSSGVYLYRVQAGSSVSTHRMLLVK